MDLRTTSTNNSKASKKNLQVCLGWLDFEDDSKEQHLRGDVRMTQQSLFPPPLPPPQGFNPGFKRGMRFLNFNLFASVLSI